jgi:hypothetical protein
MHHIHPILMSIKGKMEAESVRRVEESKSRDNYNSQHIVEFQA